MKHKKHNVALRATAAPTRAVAPARSAAPAPARSVALAPAPAPAPGVTQPLIVQAINLQNAGKLREAEALFRQILAAEPNHPAALYSLVVVLMTDPRRHGEALAFAAHGVSCAPAFAPMWLAHASVLQALGRSEEALASYDRAVQVKPDYTEALLNGGVLARDMHRHRDALERFNQILTFNPSHPSALANCGILLTEFKRSADAIRMFERLMSLAPDYDYLPGLLNYERLHACDWTDFAPLVAHIVQGVRAGKRSTKTLGLMAISDQASDHFLAARIFAQHWFGQTHPPLWTGERYNHQRLRIAYVSPDLREHPVGHLMCGIFERHDKSRFETYAVSIGIDDGSRLRQRMLAAFDHFLDARPMTPAQIAGWMRANEIDVAIDLAGYTSDSRPQIFAHRPAPVQVTYLGYPGTLGTSHFDFILADRHVIPEAHKPFYTEKVAYLPNTYLPTDASIQIAERTPTRAECGLPETGAVLCSFSHDYKIHPDLFAAWMRILRKTPGSVLWLVSRNEYTQANLRKAAAEQGVAAERLIFASRVPRVEDHLARYRLADVFLDTSPYNAHTTAADALMAGLPVVTWMGGSFPSRVAASLLHAIGLPELVADSLAAYQVLVLRLLDDPPLLAGTKAKLAANKATHPLFDTPRFCRDLEAAYVAMVEQVLPASYSGFPAAVIATAVPDLDAASANPSATAVISSPDTTTAPPAVVPPTTQPSAQRETEAVA